MRGALRRLTICALALAAPASTIPFGLIGDERPTSGGLLKGGSGASGMFRSKSSTVFIVHGSENGTVDRYNSSSTSLQTMARDADAGMGVFSEAHQFQHMKNCGLVARGAAGVTAASVDATTQFDETAHFNHNAFGRSTVDIRTLFVHGLKNAGPRDVLAVDRLGFIHRMRVTTSSCTLTYISSLDVSTVTDAACWPQDVIAVGGSTDADVRYHILCQDGRMFLTTLTAGLGVTLTLPDPPTGAYVMNFAENGGGKDVLQLVLTTRHVYIVNLTSTSAVVNSQIDVPNAAAVTIAFNKSPLRVLYICSPDGITRVDILDRLNPVVVDTVGIYKPCVWSDYKGNRLLFMVGDWIHSVTITDPLSDVPTPTSITMTTTPATTPARTPTWTIPATTPTTLPTPRPATSQTTTPVTTTSPTAVAARTFSSSVVPATPSQAIQTETSTASSPTGTSSAMDGINGVPPSVAKTEETVGNGASSVAVIAGIAGGGPGALQLAAISAACHPENPSEGQYAWVMAPVPWEVAGSWAAGALLGNLLLAAAAGLLGWGVSKVAQVAGRRLAPAFFEDLDAHGLTKFPSAPLIAFAFLYQGSALASFDLIENGATAGLVGLGVLGVACLLAIPALVLRALSTGVPSHAFLKVDPNTRSAFSVAVFGEGEWVSRRRRPHWIERWASAVRPFNEPNAWFGAVDYAGQFAVAGLQAARPRTLEGCGHVKVGLAVLFALLWALEAWRRPHAAARNSIADAVLLATQAAAMAATARGYYSEDPSSGWFGVGGALLTVCLGVLCVRTFLDVAAWLYVVLSGRRRRLQKEQFDDVGPDSFQEMAAFARAASSSLERYEKTTSFPLSTASTPNRFPHAGSSWHPLAPPHGLGNTRVPLKPGPAPVSRESSSSVASVQLTPDMGIPAANSVPPPMLLLACGQPSFKAAPAAEARGRAGTAVPLVTRPFRASFASPQTNVSAQMMPTFRRAK